MYRTSCPTCGSDRAYLRVCRGPGLSRYVSIPLGLLCLVGIVVGVTGWLAKESLSLQPATATTLLEVGVASFLLLGLLMFAELEAKRTRRVNGFCGSCGDLWTRPLSRRRHM